MNKLTRINKYLLNLGKFICGSAEEEKPKFISEPFDIEAYEGTSIELPCAGKGNPKPEVSWLIGSIELNNLNL